MKLREIEVLLVEANRDTAMSIAQNLSADTASISVDYAYRSSSVLNLVTSITYSVIIIDLDCQQFNGIELCRHLRNEGIDIPIIVLSKSDCLENKELAFNAGTDDYLVKPFAMKELQLRTKALSNRRSGQVRKLKVADLELHVETKQVVRSGQLVKLTPTNLRLLELLMRNSPAVISRSEIEDEIWPDGSPDSNNLKVQLYQLRTRIDQAFSSKLIQTVNGHGVRIGGRV